MKFTTKEELILQAKKDGACDKGIKFAESCKDLQEILETIDEDMLFWCLQKGYEEFADSCDWETFNGPYRDWETDRKSTRLNSSHRSLSRMPSSA